MTDTFQSLQQEAVERGLKAKRDHEEKTALDKVHALAGQVHRRLDSLVSRIDDVRHSLNNADEYAVHLDVGHFGHDTETIDELLHALSEASQLLAGLRAAHASTDELSADLGGRARQLVDQQVQHGGNVQPFPMPAGASVGATEGGMYL